MTTRRPKPVPEPVVTSIAPWCDTCHERVIWVSPGWLHVDTRNGWSRITKDHPATGHAWDRGERAPVRSE